MIKKLITVLAAVAIILCFINTSALAANIDEPQQQEDDTVILSGSIGKSLKRKNVTVIVTHDGADYENITENAVEFAKTVTAAPDGTYTMVWQPSETGMYDIKIYSGNITGEYQDFWYISVQELQRLEDILKEGSGAEIAQLLSVQSNLNTLGIKADELEGVSTQSMGTALYSIREYTKNYDGVLETLESAKTLAQFAESGNLNDFEKYYDELTKLSIELSDKELFDETDSDDVKKVILEIFAKNSLQDFTRVSEYFTDSIIFGGVKNSLWAGVDRYLEMLVYEKYDESSFKTEVNKAIAGRLFTSRDEIKSAIDEAVSEAKKANINVSVGSGSGGSGGGGGSGSGRVSVSVQPPKEEEKEKTVFADVKEIHWAYNEINYLRWNSIITGDSENRFNPENPVTRAELVKMLVGAFAIKGDKCDFDDVKSTDWFYSYIAAAAENGLVNGSDGHFRPNEFITRQDAAVILFRFAQNSGMKFSDDEFMFEDSTSIADYAREAVFALCTVGIINGMDSQHFAPLQPLTRAQCAKIVCSSLKKREEGEK